MKSKKIALLLAIGALAITTVSANAFDGKGPGFPPPKGGAEFSRPMPKEWAPCANKNDCDKLHKEHDKKKFEDLKRLQLTDEQKEKIEKAREKSHKKLEKITEQEKKLRQEKREIIKQNMKDFEAILTDEQKAELAKIKEERRLEMEKKKQEFEQKKQQHKNSKAQKTDKK